MKLNVMVAAIAGTACAMAAAAKPPAAQLQSAGLAGQIDAISMAAVQRGPDGKIFMVGDWVPCTGATSRGAIFNAPVWDGYGRGWNPSSTNSPGTLCTICDGTDTNLGPSDSGLRWYFGPTYHNPRTIDNIETFVGNPCNYIDEINHGFYYTVPTPTQLYMVHFLLEEFTVFDGGIGECTSSYSIACGSDPSASGVVFNFGVVPPTTGGYYITGGTFGLIGAGIYMPMPEDADGSHEIRYGVAYDTSTGVLTPHTGPIQPMLWGTGEDSGGVSGAGSELGRPGTHALDSYDDDAPADDTYSNPGECYAYTFGPGYCPVEISKMIAFLAPYCPADYNRDGFVDASDSLSYEDDFNGVNGFAGIHRADFNGDCFTDGSDYLDFYFEFNDPCV